MKPLVIILSAFLSPFRSGAEACAEEVALRLSNRCAITIVTARLRQDLPKRDFLQGKVPVVRVGFGCWFDKWLFPFLAPIAVRNIAAESRGFPLQPVIIHAILETFAGLALYLCAFTVPSAKRILTLQTTNRNFLKGFIICSADHVTAISTALITIARDLGRSNVTHIPNGIDITHITDHPKVPGRILFVGRLEKMKGVDTLLHAFAAINHPQAHLHIVGAGSERRNLEKLSRELQLGSRITFTGFIPVPQVYDEFAKAEIFCGLSRSEALGNVFLEAQAAGCAVIGTQIGGIPDIVRHQKTGLLVPPNDHNAAHSALTILLNNSYLRAEYSQAGRTYAQHYDWELIAEKYSIIYDSYSLE
jgi:glycosyltransferase involved in cell wall biosynthesis